MSKVTEKEADASVFSFFSLIFINTIVKLLYLPTVTQSAKFFFFFARDKIKELFLWSYTGSPLLNVREMYSGSSEETSVSKALELGYLEGKTMHEQKNSLYFTITDRVGGLEEVLQVLKGLNVNMTRIESRPSKMFGDYDFFVDFDLKAKDPVKDADLIQKVVSELGTVVKEVKFLSTGSSHTLAEHPHVGRSGLLATMPWFPRKKVDLDTFAEKVLSYGAELDADHPGFKDPEYRKRRDEITKRAREYVTGMPLPHVDYTKNELETWRVIYKRLITLYETHACREHRFVFPLLQQNCGFNEDNIPQIADVSRFLKECTGFTLRPVMGLLSSRDFLNGLAFRVFHSTQYIRHHSQPFYTPEPDVCHELLGHCPLFADPDFADLCQEIGLASLGASDEDIERISRIFWFTVEFGVCKEGNEGSIKAYGAGLLSSFGELEYCLSDKPKLLPFDPAVVAQQSYPITQFQPVYFVASSFKDAKDKIREFALSFNRPFELRYSALTESIEVLDSKDNVVKFASSIKSDISKLIHALDKL